MVKLTENMILSRSRSQQSLETIRKFNCWGSEITDVSIVRNMTGLQIASLSVNKIRTLEDFAHCPSLEELYIRRNDITDLAEIRHLKHLPNLHVLWLLDNPCSNVDNYRATVLRHLPELQKLDNVAVTRDEIDQARIHGDDLRPPGNSFQVEDFSLRPPVPVPDLRRDEIVPAVINSQVSTSSSDGGRQEEGQLRLLKAFEEMELNKEEEDAYDEDEEKKDEEADTKTKVDEVEEEEKEEEEAKDSNVLQALIFLLEELDKNELLKVQEIVHRKLNQKHFHD